MKNSKFIIFSGKNEQFYFRLTAPNGEPILASEGYATKSGCKNGIQSVKSNSPEDSQYKRLGTSSGQFYFNLTANNGEVIGKSETYKTKQGRENSIESVKSNAPDAPLEDTTD